MKIIKVKNCKNCPYRDLYEQILGFSHNTKLKCIEICRISDKTKPYSKQKEIINLDIIPDWCPLEDYKDENN